MFVTTHTCRAPPAGLAVWWFSALQFPGYCRNTKTKTTSKTPAPSILPIQNGVRDIAAEIFHQSYQQRHGLHTQHINSGRCEIQALEIRYQPHVEPQILNMQNLPMKGKPLDSFTQYNSWCHEQFCKVLCLNSFFFMLFKLDTRCRQQFNWVLSIHIFSKNREEKWISKIYKPQWGHISFLLFIPQTSLAHSWSNLTLFQVNYKANHFSKIFYSSFHHSQHLHSYHLHKRITYCSSSSYL